MKILPARHKPRVLARRVSETVGKRADWGLREPLQKKPRAEGIADAGQGALLCSRGEAR
jgi:hypothetical protein